MLTLDGPKAWTADIREAHRIIAGRGKPLLPSGWQALDAADAARLRKRLQAQAVKR